MLHIKYSHQHLRNVQQKFSEADGGQLPIILQFDHDCMLQNNIHVERTLHPKQVKCVLYSIQGMTMLKDSTVELKKNNNKKTVIQKQKDNPVLILLTYTT